MPDWARIRRLGNSLVVILARCLSATGIRAGDSLLVPKASGELSRNDPDFTETLEAGRDFMRRYPEAMKTLAK